MKTTEINDKTTEDDDDFTTVLTSNTASLYSKIKHPLNVIGSAIIGSSDTETKKNNIEVITDINNEQNDNDSITSNSSDKKNFLNGFKNLMKKRKSKSNISKSKKEVKWNNNDLEYYYEANSSNPI